MPERENPKLLFDANIIIDLLRIKSSRSLLQLIVRYIGKPVVLSIILEEEILAFGKDSELDVVLSKLETHDIDLNDLFFANTSNDTRTSFNDKLCLAAAKRMNATLISNDKPLHHLCKIHDVKIFWMFDLLVLLNQQDHLSRNDALAYAENIRSINNRITPFVLEKLSKQLH